MAVYELFLDGWFDMAPASLKLNSDLMKWVEAPSIEILNKYLNDSNIQCAKYPSLLSEHVSCGVDLQIDDAANGVFSENQGLEQWQNEIKEAKAFNDSMKARASEKASRGATAPRLGYNTGIDSKLPILANLESDYDREKGLLYSSGKDTKVPLNGWGGGRGIPSPPPFEERLQTYVTDTPFRDFLKRFMPKPLV